MQYTRVHTHTIITYMTVCACIRIAFVHCPPPPPPPVADLYNNSETMKRRYFDLLTSYRMPPDSLYSYVNIDPSVADYMASTGSKWFNLLNFGGLVFRLQNGIPPEQDSRDHWHEGLRKSTHSQHAVCSTCWHVVTTSIECYWLHSKPVVPACPL